MAIKVVMAGIEGWPGEVQKVVASKDSYPELWMQLGQAVFDDGEQVVIMDLVSFEKIRDTIFKMYFDDGEQ